jgi:hypothetical protein
VEKSEVTLGESSSTTPEGEEDAAKTNTNSSNLMKMTSSMSARVYGLLRGQKKKPEEAPSAKESEVPSIEEGELPSIEEGEVPSIEEGEVPSIEEGDVPSIEEGEVPSSQESSRVLRGPSPAPREARL